MGNAFHTHITDTDNSAITSRFNGSADQNYIFHPTQTHGCMNSNVWKKSTSEYFHKSLMMLICSHNLFKSPRVKCRPHYFLYQSLADVIGSFKLLHSPPLKCAMYERENIDGLGGFKQQPLGKEGSAAPEQPSPLALIASHC